MNSALGREQRMVWSLWLAAALVMVGGLMPLMLGGTSSRISGVIAPFAIGAVALAACAVLPRQSRTAIAAVYFVAGLAIVYGLLSMAALPVRLAALGSCPALPAPCPTGLPRVLTDGENNGMGTGTALGIIGLLIGFFGLVTIYRHPVLQPFTPPERKIAPMPPAPMPPPPVTAASASAAPVSPSSDSLDSQDSQAPGDAVSLDQREEDPELPAPEELPELPSHESSTPTT